MKKYIHTLNQMYSESTKAKYNFKDSKVNHGDAIEFMFEQNQQLITLMSNLIEDVEAKKHRITFLPIEDDLKGII